MPSPANGGNRHTTNDLPHWPLWHGVSLQRLMSTFSQDVRYAFRTLTRTPAFSLVVILTLGLGIGANTAIFSLTDQVLLRLLPVKDPRNWCSSMGQGRSAAERRTIGGSPIRCMPISAIAMTSSPASSRAWRQRHVDDAQSGRTRRRRARVGQHIRVLGASPAIGRALTQTTTARRARIRSPSSATATGSDALPARPPS